MPAWTDVVGAVGGSVGTITAVATALWTVKRSREDRADRLADSELNRQQHEATAAIAKEAADAAARSATEARKLADVHLAGHHRSLAPTQRSVPTHLVTTPTGPNLFGTVKVERDYRAQAWGLRGNERQRLTLDMLLTANTEHNVHLERWSNGQTRPKIDAVLLRLWPPASIDQVEQWSCDCGRPTIEGREDEQAHWEIRLSVEPPGKRTRIHRQTTMTDRYEPVPHHLPADLLGEIWETILRMRPPDTATDQRPPTA
jgi:hypothetical protein